MKKYIIIFLLPLAIACKKDPEANPIPPPGNPDIKLKEVLWHGLPAPLYNFTYNNQGQVSTAGYSDDVRSYDIVYSNGRVSELSSTRSTNDDRIQYLYTDGKVSVLKYINDAGETFMRCYLTYNNLGQLKNMEWEVKDANVGFALQRTYTFSYYPDGNLSGRIEEYHEINGQHPPQLYIDEFSDYDNKHNSDGFMLLHPSQQHLVFLPGVQLQKNNPRKVIRSGTGVNYRIDYTYQYSNKNYITNKLGDMLFTTGNDAGKRITLNVDYTYY